MQTIMSHSLRDILKTRELKNALRSITKEMRENDLNRLSVEVKGVTWVIEFVNNV